MHQQEPGIEDRTTRGDVVGAIVASIVCIALVALAVTFIDTKDRPSALSSLPMDAPSSLLAP
jgi:hypothetical protein